MKLFFSILTLSALNICAQQFSAGAVFDPSSFSSKDEAVILSSSSFASVLLERFEISKDTKCPNFPYFQLDKSGFTRTELIAAAIVAQKKGEDFCACLKELKKEGLKKFSEKKGFDPKELFTQAQDGKKEIEKKVGDEIEAMRAVWLSSETLTEKYEE